MVVFRAAASIEIQSVLVKAPILDSGSLDTFSSFDVRLIRYVLFTYRQERFREGLNWGMPAGWDKIVVTSI